MFRLPFRTLLGFAVLVLPMSTQADLVVNGTFDVFVPINETGGGWTNINTDGVFVFESPGLTDRLFHSFNVNFVAPAGSVTLALAAERNGTDSDFAVDNISLNAVSAPATPEPGAYALVLAGGLSGTAAKDG